METDLRFFIIVGLFFAIALGFFSQVARTKERIEHPPNSWMNVFNLLLILVFIIVYLFLMMVVLNNMLK